SAHVVLLSFPTRRSSDLGRGEFMRPFGPELMLVLVENHVLEGYRGQDLNADAPLTRYEIAFLLGRTIRLVNARDGRIFPRNGSRSEEHTSELQSPDHLVC